jgi:hypothetical protein
MSGTPSRHDDERKASTTTTTIARSTTDDRGRGQRHDSDDDHERSWSPNQRGPRAFGWSIRDAVDG